jgi:LmbE family N-acetylglucosaminyl deacetylase
MQRRQEAAVVVAHPDDEAMWGVSYPLRQSGFAWSVIVCSTPAHDPQRILSVHRSCEIFGCRLIVLDEQTRGALTFPGLDLAPYSFLVTHNAKGEYGHKQHIQVHEKVKLARKPYICFGYGYGNPHVRIQLTPEETATRIQALPHKDPEVRRALQARRRGKRKAYFRQYDEKRDRAPARMATKRVAARARWRAKYPAPTRPEPTHCELCGTAAKRTLCLDHCHITNTFRGWLCHGCNAGLGLFKDNPVTLRAAAYYVEMLGPWKP